MRYIEKIPIMNGSSDRKVNENIKFPMTIGEMRSISIKNEKTGLFLTWNDKVFAMSSEKGEKGDVICISFIPHTMQNIEITLEISDIFYYGCDLQEEGPVQSYGPMLQGARIDIMDRNDYIDETNPAKYMLLIYDSVMQIDADEIYVKDVKYIEPTKVLSYNIMKKEDAKNQIECWDGCEVFPRYVSAIFDFLTTEYGLRQTVCTGYVAFYENEDISVYVTSGGKMKFAVRDNSIYDHLAVSLDDILSCNNIYSTINDCEIKNEQELFSCLQQMAEYTKKYAIEFLKGEEKAYREVLNQEREMVVKERKNASKRNRNTMKRQAKGNDNMTQKEI